MKINFDRAENTKNESCRTRFLCICSSKMLLYLPLLLLSTSGIWFGVRIPDTAGSLISLCLPALLAAAAEELIFRGLVYHAALKFTGSTAFAAGLSAVLFGAGHFVSYAGLSGPGAAPPAARVCQVIFAVCAGLMLAALVGSSGSLLPGIVFHCLNNFFQVIGDKEAALAFFGGNPVLMSIVSAAVLSPAFLVYAAFLYRKRAMRTLIC